VLGARRGQLSALLVVAGRAPTGLPMLLLFDGQIPHIPSLPTVLCQNRLLLSGRKQPISRHTGNVSATTDKLTKGEAALAPRTKTRNFHAATTP
jgi:hypothetical protein